MTFEALLLTLGHFLWCVWSKSMDNCELNSLSGDDGAAATRDHAPVRQRLEDCAWRTRVRLCVHLRPHPVDCYLFVFSPAQRLSGPTPPPAPLCTSPGRPPGSACPPRTPCGPGCAPGGRTMSRGDWGRRCTPLSPSCWPRLGYWTCLTGSCWTVKINPKHQIPVKNTEISNKGESGNEGFTRQVLMPKELLSAYIHVWKWFIPDSCVDTYFHSAWEQPACLDVIRLQNQKWK